MKRITSLLLSVIIIISSIPVSGILTFAADELIEYGNYPQSRVTDSSLIAQLDSVTSQWKSYDYFTGTGSWYDGTMTSSDFMKYRDVRLGDKWYRGVTFDSFRPYWTGYDSSENNSVQDNNGYETGTTYWFLFEPLKWRVLDKDRGLLLCETIIDSQPYNNYLIASGKDYRGYTAYWGNADKTYYANNYVESSIRKWLSDDFINTAFTSRQIENISVTHLENSCSDPSKTAFNAPESDDKVFLLSMNDALNNTYGFSEYLAYGDSARKAGASDYAKCQGLTDFGEDSSWWWLRTAEAGSGSCDSFYVNYNGKVNQHSTVTYTNHGVRPAMILSEIKNDTAVRDCNHEDTDANSICDICGTVISVENPDNNCSHICHKTGFAGFIWRILNWFNRLFRTNKNCACGNSHY